MKKIVGYEGLITELLTQEEKERISKLLEEASLTNREVEIIRHRFGLDTEPKPLGETAVLLRISKERVRQIEFKALQKLRKRWAVISFLGAEKSMSVLEGLRTRIENLESYMDLFGELAGKIMVKNMETGVSPEELKLYDRLLIPVSELELSVRSSNCLREGGFKYLYQLVVKIEEELLYHKNLGKKSLCEIKELLADLGLSLGMKLPAKFLIYHASRKDLE